MAWKQFWCHFISWILVKFPIWANILLALTCLSAPDSLIYNCSLPAHIACPPHPLGHTLHIRQINLWPLSIFVFFWDLQFAILANKVMTSLCVQICLFTILQFAIAILVVFSRYLLDQFHALSLLLLLASQLLLLLYLIHYIIYCINYILYIISISSQVGNIAFEIYNVITHVSKQEIVFNTLKMCTRIVREALKKHFFFQE